MRFSAALHAGEAPGGSCLKLQAVEAVMLDKVAAVCPDPPTCAAV